MSRIINIKEFILRTVTCGFLALVFMGTGVCATIPPDITKTVVFIYKDAAGTPMQADGTGFILSIPSPVPDRSWLYLVTAKHVVYTDSNDASSPLYTKLWIRVNKRSGGSTMYGLSLIASGEHRSLFFHSDPSVDIAVVTIAPTEIDAIDTIDIKTLPEQMLTNADDFKTLSIGVGTDMFFTGMFTPFLGEKRSYPIVRFGKLAMIPDEKISFAGTSVEGYLMEAFSFGGNSGSPVFFYPSADNTPGVMVLGSRPIKIAGVMKGFFGDAEPILLASTQTATPGPKIPVSKGNTGIALVVPAKFVSEILHSPELETARQINR